MPLKDIPFKELGLSIQMVGAVYADKSRTWLVMFPGEPDHIEAHQTKVVSLNREEWEQFLRQTDLVEVECVVRDPETKVIGKAMLRKSERQISQQTSWAVFRRDGFRCRYCGVEDQPLTVDHLITWESGGPSTPENLVAACKKCNGARGETPFEQWLTDPYFKRVSQNLAFEERFRLQALVPSLAKIPVSVRVGKRQR